jgi:outer membrane lipoprotein SlyB
MRKFTIAALTLAAVVSTAPAASAQDALGGAIIGAGAGAAIGGAATRSGEGAAIGAGIGAVTGAAIGASAQPRRTYRYYDEPRAQVIVRDRGYRTKSCRINRYGERVCVIRRY